MYGCESWTTEKVECWRIDAFELWCWRRLLRVPWTAKRSNQSILKEISPEYSLESDAEAETLSTWCEELTHWKRPWCWERLKAGAEGTTEDMVGWHHWLNGHGFGWTLGVGDGQRGLVCWSSWGRKESDRRLSWTELITSRVSSRWQHSARFSQALTPAFFLLAFQSPSSIT